MPPSNTYRKVKAGFLGPSSFRGVPFYARDYPPLSVLYSFWVARFVAFNGKVMRELAAHFLTLAENKGERSR